ncbi:Hpt domain-containing protein [Nostocoides sp. HKS02]|uniref:Hpt domain-containing protein n=1 Tax=Nostocoides sp. HKS02 TaxID=1813880 RepID=UPI0018A880FE|nr:Hpt domain-containing protein [Tetrasphaera sp. HKS02]
MDQEPMDHEPMDAAMAAFRDRARATNLARAQVIAEALQSMHDGELVEDVRLTASRAAHSLAGSAGTFGFAAASQLGRDLEALLDGVDEPARVDDAEVTQARAARGLAQVAQLREALAATPTTNGRESGEATT